LIKSKNINVSCFQIITNQTIVLQLGSDRPVGPVGPWTGG